MTGTLLVSPPDRFESHCLVRAFEQAGIPATSSYGDDVRAVVLLALPGAESELDDRIGPPGRLPILVVTPLVDEGSIHLAEANGAVGLVEWRADTQELVDAVSAMICGSSELPGLPTAPEADPLGALTEREHEIVGLLARGSRNEEIASELGISYHTVRTHVQHVLTKLDLSHRHAVAVLAQRSERHRATSVDVPRVAAIRGRT